MPAKHTTLARSLLKNKAICPHKGLHRDVHNSFISNQNRGRCPVTGRQATHFGMLLRWAATEQQNENTDAHSPDEEPNIHNTVMCMILYDSIIKELNSESEIVSVATWSRGKGKG